MSYANRLSSLRKKLASRDGIPGYEKNCEMIKAEIARLEAMTSNEEPAK